MKKKVIIIVVVLLLLGGGYWLMNRDKNDDASNNAQPAASTSGTNNSAFDALATNGASYAATITATANGKTTSATMEYDKNTGAIKYSAGSGSSAATVIYTKDAYYICQTASKCYKYPISGSNSSGFDPSSYEYSSDKLNSLRNTAVDKGTMSCPAGTCHVWQVSVGGYTSTIYIDTATKRISQVEGTTAAGSSKIVYEYKDVTVTPPANAKTLPTGNSSSDSSYTNPY